MTTISLSKPIQNATGDRLVFSQNAIELMGKIVNDRRFLDSINQAVFSDSLCALDSGEIVQLTNQQLVDKIVTGKEYKTTADDVISLLIKFARLGRGTIGSMTPPSPLITTNTRYLSIWMANNDQLSLAGQWMHEWMHVAGMRHRSSTPDFLDSTYQVGQLFVNTGRLIELASDKSPDSVAKLGLGYVEGIKTMKIPEELVASETESSK